MTSAAAAPGREATERRIAALLAHFPPWLGRAVARLREPRMIWFRIPAGVLLLLGGCLAILPVLGLWMLPLGVVLLADDIPPFRRVTACSLAWLERRRPAWFAPPPD